MANLADLPFAAKTAQEVQWTKRTRKRPKIDFPDPPVPWVEVWFGAEVASGDF
jgi:hypothetical protein